MFEVQSVRPAGTRDFAAQMPGLIEALGRKDFAQRLFAAARNVTDCHTVTCFLFDRTGSPRLLLAENIGEVPVSKHIAEKYLSDYWRFDPAGRVDVGGDSDATCKAMMIHADDIEHMSYRQHCYGAVNLDSRMTIMRPVDGRVVRVNFYRGRQNSGSGGLESIVAAGEMLVSLLARHDTWSAPPPARDDFAYAERLRRACPSLPRREAEVCALITQGYSSEAISLKLGIAVNTVLTFRRRAYARLRISSQNELMHLVLS